MVSEESRVGPDSRRSGDRFRILGSRPDDGVRRVGMGVHSGVHPRSDSASGRRAHRPSTTAGTRQV